jgi:hypothetical protein
MAKEKDQTEQVEQPEEEKKLTAAQILEKVVSGEITPEQAKELDDERRKKPIGFKRGGKGTFCITGVRRFPVINLYGGEIEKVAEVWPKFLDWVAEEQAKEEAAKAEEAA